MKTQKYSILRVFKYQSCTEEWNWPNTEDQRSSLMKIFRIPKTEGLCLWKFSEYRRPKIFIHENFPNTEDRRPKIFVLKNFRIPQTEYLQSWKISEYRIVFVHKKFLNTKDFMNTKYWIVFIYKIVWIPNNKEENKSSKIKKREKRKENYRKNVWVIVMWHAY